MYYFESEGDLVCINTLTWEEQWRHKTGEYVKADFTIIDDTILVYSMDLFMDIFPCSASVIWDLRLLAARLPPNIFIICDPNKSTNAGRLIF